MTDRKTEPEGDSGTMADVSSLEFPVSSYCSSQPGEAVGENSSLISPEDTSNIDDMMSCQSSQLPTPSMSRSETPVLPRLDLSRVDTSLSAQLDLSQMDPRFVSIQDISEMETPFLPVPPLPESPTETPLLPPLPLLTGHPLAPSVLDYSDNNGIHSCLSSVRSLASAMSTPLTMKKFKAPDSDAGTDLLPVCRICQLPGDKEDFLFSPCRCSGTMMFVHYLCLLVSACCMHTMSCNMLKEINNCKHRN